MPQFTREYEQEPRAPTSTSGLAIMSLVLSLLGYVCLWGAGGLVGLVLGIMAQAQISSSDGRLRGRGLATAGIVLGIINILLVLSLLPVALLLPAIQKVRGAASRVHDANNLKQIGIAMHQHASDYNRFPAAAIKSKDGKPLLSWRVAILPYIEEDALYRRFHLDEPWDSPHNLTLLPLMPKVYVNPNDPVEFAKDGMTRYRVFVGPGTLFEDREGGVKFADVSDGTSNTLMVVESRDAVPWTKPDHLPFNPKDFTVPTLGDEKMGGLNVLMADGSVIFIKLPINEQVLKLLIQRDDNMPVDVEKLSK